MPGGLQSPRRTGIETTTAIAATVLLGAVVVEFQRSDNLTEEEERAFTGDDKVGILANPAKAGFPGPITFEKRCGVGENPSFKVFRSRWITSLLPPLKRGKVTPSHYLLSERIECLREGWKKFFRDVLPELTELVFHDEVVILAISIVRDAGGIGRLLLCRIIIKGDRDNRTGTFDQAGRVQTDIPVVLHIFHPSMTSFCYPTVKKQSFGVCRCHFSYSAGIEA